MPPDFSCGSDVPAYINNVHPTTLDTPVNVQICGNYIGNACWLAMDGAKVMKCSQGYFVYYLPEMTKCSVAYCGTDANVIGWDKDVEKWQIFGEKNPMKKKQLRD